jgi:hypothetical protein
LNRAGLFLISRREARRHVLSKPDAVETRHHGVSAARMMSVALTGLAGEDTSQELFL